MRVAGHAVHDPTRAGDQAVRALFCTPGRLARNLSVTFCLALPREGRTGMSSRSVRSGALAVGREVKELSRATSTSWILPRPAPGDHLQPLARGVTMRHEARLSSAAPQSTAFATRVIATLPPTHEALGRRRIDREDETRALGRVGDTLRRRRLEPDRGHRQPRQEAPASPPRSWTRASGVDHHALPGQRNGAPV